jgi:hypothetical protein
MTRPGNSYLTPVLSARRRQPLLSGALLPPREADRAREADRGSARPRGSHSPGQAIVSWIISSTLPSPQALIHCGQPSIFLPRDSIADGNQRASSRNIAGACAPCASTRRPLSPRPPAESRQCTGLSEPSLTHWHCSVIVDGAPQSGPMPPIWRTPPVVLIQLGLPCATFVGCLRSRSTRSKLCL